MGKVFLRRKNFFFLGICVHPQKFAGSRRIKEKTFVFKKKSPGSVPPPPDNLFWVHGPFFPNPESPPSQKPAFPAVRVNKYF